MAWTASQQAALDSKGATLVSASAGTGKTAIMTEKVVQTILDGTSIKNILIVTFSNAADHEMKERIKSRLFEVVKDQSLGRIQRSYARNTLNSTYWYGAMRIGHDAKRKLCT